MLRVSLLQVGAAPAVVWRPSSSVSFAFRFVVAAPVAFRLLPYSRQPEQQQQHNTPFAAPAAAAAAAAANRLQAPLILAPNTVFPLEPQGGSGNKP